MQTNIDLVFIYQILASPLYNKNFNKINIRQFYIILKFLKTKIKMSNEIYELPIQTTKTNTNLDSNDGHHQLYDLEKIDCRISIKM